MKGKLVLLSALCLALTACGRGAPPIENVVLLSIDTLRPDVLGCYGATDGVSPNLDRLAAGGVVFEQAVAQAPWTHPSHASLMTSRFPAELDLGGFATPRAIPAAAVTLAEVLAANGYATAAVTGGGYLSEALAFDQGFESFLGDFACRRMSVTVSGAVRWLARRDEERPFFLFLHTWEVHQYRPPAAERARWVRPYDGPLADVEELGAWLQAGGRRAEQARFGPQDWRYARDVYRATVASADTQLGRLLGELEARGLRERTLLVVISDHGEELGEHGGGGHGYTLYDENLRVPLILAHPALAPQRVERQVRLLDVAPTILDLLGVAAPETWRGRSLAPLLSGETPVLPAFAEAGHRPLVALRTAHYKTVFHAGGQAQVFALEEDPGERHPLPAARSAEVRDRHRRALLAHLEEAVRGRAELGRGAAPESSELARDLARLGYAGDEPQGEAPAAPGGSMTLETWLRLLRDGG